MTARISGTSHIPSPDSPGVLNWTLILTLGVMWGAAFMGQALALDGFGPMTLAALRTVIGAVALTGIAAILGQGPGRVLAAGKGRGLVVLASLGVVTTAAPFALLAWGLQHVPSAFAGVAMGAVPLLLLPLVAIFSPEEGIGPRRIAGVLLGFVGLVLLVGPGATDGGSPHLLAGRLACIGAAMCYAVGSVVTRRAPHMPPIGFAALVLAFGAVPLVPLALAVEGVPRDWPAGPTAALVLTGLFPTGLAAAIRVRVITTAGSLFMSLTSYMVPVWSLIFGITLMDEVPTATLFAGLALILAGIGTAQSRAIGAALNRRRPVAGAARGS